jgi:hypothetical protein
MTFNRPHPYLLVLDLDSTLVFVSSEPKRFGLEGARPDFTVGRKKGWIRPGCIELLCFAHAMSGRGALQVAVWTAAPAAYAHAVIEAVWARAGLEPSDLAFIWSDGQCEKTFRGRPRTMKPLALMAQQAGVLLERAIAVDDNSDTYRGNPRNAMAVSAWRGPGTRAAREDPTLSRVQRFLSSRLPLERIGGGGGGGGSGGGAISVWTWGLQRWQEQELELAQSQSELGHSTGPVGPALVPHTWGLRRRFEGTNASGVALGVQSTRLISERSAAASAASGAEAARLPHLAGAATGTGTSAGDADNAAASCFDATIAAALSHAAAAEAAVDLT